MATLLAHIQVKTGRETEFEKIASELFRDTHANEIGCTRYEYWRGAKPGHYYSLLSFDDFHAFLRHQVSEHHEAASPKIGAVCESVELEWVDPISDASPLGMTDMQPLPDGADDLTRRYHEMFSVKVQDWWPRDPGEKT